MAIELKLKGDTEDPQIEKGKALIFIEYQDEKTLAFETTEKTAQKTIDTLTQLEPNEETFIWLFDGEGSSVKDCVGMFRFDRTIRSIRIF